MSTPGLEALLGRAEAALDVRRLEEAERAARGALALEPGSEAGHGLLARALMSQGRHADALAAAESGLAATPDSEWLHRLRAVQLQALKRLPEALDAADAAIRLAPDLGQAHQTRSLVLEALRRLPEARLSSERAVALEPEKASFHAHAGDLWVDEDPARAERHYREALALDPESAVTLNDLGVALSKQKRHREAALAFRSAVLVDPTLEVAKQNAGGAIDRMKGGPALLVGVAVVFQGARWLDRSTRFGGAWASVRGWAVGVGLAAAAVGLAVWWWREVAGEKRLRAEEPMLFELQRRLEADQRARVGRIWWHLRNTPIGRLRALWRR